MEARLWVLDYGAALKGHLEQVYKRLQTKWNIRNLINVEQTENRLLLNQVSQLRR